MKKMIGLQLEEEIIEKLNELAKEDCRPLASFVRNIIMNYLKSIEK